MERKARGIERRFLNIKFDRERTFSYTHLVQLANSFARSLNNFEKGDGFNDCAKRRAVRFFYYPLLLRIIFFSAVRNKEGRRAEKKADALHAPKRPLKADFFPNGTGTRITRRRRYPFNRFEAAAPNRLFTDITTSLCPPCV